MENERTERTISMFMRVCALTERTIERTTSVLFSK